MKIRTGSLDVLESGTVHSKRIEPTEFVLGPQMVLRVVIEQSKDAPPSIQVNPSETTLVMTFTNPKIQLHFGPQEPILIGELNGRRLYCMLRMNVFGEYSSYSIDYTFYLGEKV